MKTAKRINTADAFVRELIEAATFSAHFGYLEHGNEQVAVDRAIHDIRFRVDPELTPILEEVEMGDSDLRRHIESAVASSGAATEVAFAVSGRAADEWLIRAGGVANRNAARAVAS